jgi:hypothetical protein
MAGEVAFFELGVEDAERGRELGGVVEEMDVEGDQGSPFGLHQPPSGS